MSRIWRGLLVAVCGFCHQMCVLWCAGSPQMGLTCSVSIYTCRCQASPAIWPACLCDCCYACLLLLAQQRKSLVGSDSEPSSNMCRAQLGFTSSADKLQWQPAALTPLATADVIELQMQLSCHLLCSLPLDDDSMPRTGSAAKPRCCHLPELCLRLAYATVNLRGARTPRCNQLSNAAETDRCCVYAPQRPAHYGTQARLTTLLGTLCCQPSAPREAHAPPLAAADAAKLLSSLRGHCLLGRRLLLRCWAEPARQQFEGHSTVWASLDKKLVCDPFKASSQHRKHCHQCADD